MQCRGLAVGRTRWTLLVVSVLCRAPPARLFVVASFYHRCNPSHMIVLNTFVNLLKIAELNFRYARRQHSAIGWALE